MAKKPATPTTKGPSGPKSARTRERILDAAAAVLSRKGYAGTRLTDVAEHADVQAPAIYYYFPSREDLIEEVMYVGIAGMTEHVEKALADSPGDATPMQRIEIAVEAQLRYELEVSDYAIAAIRNAGQIPEELRVRYDAEGVKFAAMWRALMKDAAAAGELRADLDPSVARMLVMGALNWTTEWWNPRRGSMETVVKTTQSLVRHGLGVDPETTPKPRKRAAAKK